MAYLSYFGPLGGDMDSIRGLLALGMGHEAWHMVRGVNTSPFP